MLVARIDRLLSPRFKIYLALAISHEQLMLVG